MPALNEKELIKKIAKRSKQTEEHSAEMLAITFDEIYKSLKRGESVTLRNVGKFYVSPKKDTWVFKFSPSQKWRKMLGWASTYKGEL